MHASICQATKGGCEGCLHVAEQKVNDEILLASLHSGLCSQWAN